MWMMELATKTITAETRIGIQSDITETMHTSIFSKFSKFRRDRRLLKTGEDASSCEPIAQGPERVKFCGHRGDTSRATLTSGEADLTNIGGSFTSVLGAIAIAKRKDGAVTATSGNEAEMIFDDVNYDRLPAQIAYDGVPSQSNAANATIVSLYRPIPNLGAGTANAIVRITGWGKNDQNQVVTSSGNVSVGAHLTVGGGLQSKEVIKSAIDPSQSQAE
jgi:hypothetical protein